MWFTVYVMELEAIQPSCWCLMISYLLKKKQGHWVCPWNHTSHFYWTTDHCFCFDKPKQTPHIISHLDLWRSKKNRATPQIIQVIGQFLSIELTMGLEYHLASPVRSRWPPRPTTRFLVWRKMQMTDRSRRLREPTKVGVIFAIQLVSQKKHGIQLHMWRVDILKYMW